MNYATIAGHLGGDPEVRFTSSGQKVTTFSLAARCRKTTKDKDETIWWRVTIWGEQFDKMIPYLKKGSPLIVMGDVHQPEIFTDRDNKSRVSMSLTANHIAFSPFGRPASAGEQSPASVGEMHEERPAAEPVPAAATYGRGERAHAVIADDEVPF